MRSLPADPRYLQIAFLGSFLLCGLFVQQIVPPWQPPLLLVSACATQLLWARRLRLPESGLLSAVITALGLCLLLRTDLPAVLPLVAALSISSKFLIRVGGKHVFNPANFGLVLAMICTPHVWSSPSQWGDDTVLLIWFLLLGCAVVHRAFRRDISFAFLVAWIVLKAARVEWLGQRSAVLFHQLQSPAIIVFAFFMISDPRSTPDHRRGRIGYAFVVAALGFWLQTEAWMQTGLLYALFACSPLVPLLDRWFVARRHAWRVQSNSNRAVVPPSDAASGATPNERMAVMSQSRVTSFGPRVPLRLMALVALLSVPSGARAFCGFYVGKAGAELYNQASQVVLARDGERTIVTMSNDFKGTLTDFALVVPVPSVITKDQIHVGERRYIERVDAWSAPRLVEYHDEDPCQSRRYDDRVFRQMPSAAMGSAAAPKAERARSLGVTIEAQYTVGEYDIVILSAKQSEGLTTFLIESGYNIPPRAEAALGPYIKQGMKFFVARVNLKEQAKGGYGYLRPIQIAYESKKFMLPIRLGMANAQGPQDLLIYALTRHGRVESTNYQTVPMPTGMDVPVFVQHEFAAFYKATFKTAWEKAGKKALHTEYVWDTGWCDPCAAEPLSREELKGLGVFWLDDPNAGGAPVLTRLHVRYDSEHFPEDLVFQETGDRQNFQGRYVLRHAFQGATCQAAAAYYAQVDQRHGQEARTLQDLTRWSEAEVFAKMGLDAPGHSSTPWYKRLWK